MAYNKEVDEFDDIPEFAHLSFGEYQWRAFDEQMRKEYKTGNEFNYTQFLIDAGALVKNKHRFDRYHAVKDTKLYTEFNDKISKWLSWGAKKQYGESMRLEQLEKTLANTMQS